MAGNTYGTLFRVTTFGESHGAALGAVIDGCPAGALLSEELLQCYLDRRRPGRSRFVTARQEADRCRILSGVFEGRTTGTPIAVLVQNADQHSGDYSAVRDCYRPGHADFCYDQKYGFRDYRGGGRSSGRETLGRVIGGAVAAAVLKSFGIETQAWTERIGPVRVTPGQRTLSACSRNSLWMPDTVAAERAEKYLEELMGRGDSAGGEIACSIRGVPAGLGEPVFDKLDAELAKAVMSIGAVKGVQFGSGFAVAALCGSENNDSFCAAERGESGSAATAKGSNEAELRVPGTQSGVAKRSNHAGGILGGISDGSEIFFTAAVKPTPSIAKRQRTVTRAGEETEIEIRGRHDPVIVPRAVVVVECMANMVFLDMLMRNALSRLDSLKRVYGVE